MKQKKKFWFLKFCRILKGCICGTAQTNAKFIQWWFLNQSELSKQFVLVSIKLFCLHLTPALGEKGEHSFLICNFLILLFFILFLLFLPVLSTFFLLLSTGHDLHFNFMAILFFFKLIKEYLELRKCCLEKMFIFLFSFQYFLCFYLTFKN